MDAFLSFYYLEKSAQLNFISKEGCQVLSFACNVSMCFVFIWRGPGIDPGVVDSKRATLINFIFLSKLFAPGPERAGPSADVFQIQHAFFLSNPNHAYTDSCVKTPSLIYGMAFAGYSCFRISALEKNWVTALANIIHSAVALIHFLSPLATRCICWLLTDLYSKISIFAVPSHLPQPQTRSLGRPHVLKGARPYYYYYYCHMTGKCDYI